MFDWFRKKSKKEEVVRIDISNVIYREVDSPVYGLLDIRCGYDPGGDRMFFTVERMSDNSTRPIDKGLSDMIVRGGLDREGYLYSNLSDPGVPCVFEESLKRCGYLLTCIYYQSIWKRLGVERDLDQAFWSEIFPITKNVHEVSAHYDKLAGAPGPSDVTEINGKNYFAREAFIYNCAADRLLADYNVFNAVFAKKEEVARLDSARVDCNNELIGAARKGDMEGVMSAINRGADVNATGENDWNAVMYAALYGHADCLRVLLDAGADANAVDNRGETAVACAAYAGHEDCLLLLIGAGADINAADVDGQTAALCAVRKDHADCVRLLIIAGADVNAADKSGLTVAMYASWNGYADILRLLIERAADVDAADISGRTPAMLAVERGHTDCLRLLIESGANV